LVLKTRALHDGGRPSSPAPTEEAGVGCPSRPVEEALESSSDTALCVATIISPSPPSLVEADPARQGLGRIRRWHIRSRGGHFRRWQCSASSSLGVLPGPAAGRLLPDNRGGASIRSSVAVAMALLPLLTRRGAKSLGEAARRVVGPERTLMPLRGGVNRRDDQIKPFSPEKLELHWSRRLDRLYQAVRPPLMCRTTGGRLDRVQGRLDRLVQ
jgi:hypothetical protein